MPEAALKLVDGTRIAVIGGGPAGSFFAYLMLTEAAKRGLRVQLTILDSKDFQLAGRQGCNMCAGALSGHLIQLLETEGYTFPPQVVQRYIRGYVVHSHAERAHLPQKPGEAIYTVFRGVPFPEMAFERGSFDQFLLDRAVSAGAQHVRAAVRGIEMPASPGDPVRLMMRAADSTPFEADLVVGAFGVNSPLTHHLTFGYRAPTVWRAFQGEVAAPNDFITRQYGDCVHIFLGDAHRIKFLALTPKRHHVTLSAIGPDVKRVTAVERLQQPDFAPFLPEGWTLRCHCHPAFPVSAAVKPHADRAVIIGDAYISRYLKNGIESAYDTARFAVETILEHGFSNGAFRDHYVPACEAKYKWDNRYGKILFAVNDLFCLLPILANAHIRAVSYEQTHLRPEKRRHSQVLWDVFTGDRAYAGILLDSLHPMVHVRTGWETFKGLLWRMQDLAKRRLARKGKGF